MFQPLPRLMVAPNGARRTKADHPALPIRLGEVVETAVACDRAGAEGIHLHVRDNDAQHSLDVGLYREAVAAVEQAVPNFFVQVTSESAGRFGPDAQMKMIGDLRPKSVSLALRELMRAPNEVAGEFYKWARDEGICIHHILYSPDELRQFLDGVSDGLIPGIDHQLQLVLGSYAGAAPSRPQDIDAYQVLIDGRKGDLALDWMMCAFGSTETACLVETARRGGKMRVGFENSLWNADGSLAKNNAERVSDVVAALKAAGQTLSPDDK